MPIYVWDGPQASGQWRLSGQHFARGANRWRTTRRSWVYSQGQFRLVSVPPFVISVPAGNNRSVTPAEYSAVAALLYPGDKLIITVPGGTTIGSDSNSTAALRVAGWPPGVEITVNIDGALVGAGGAGGAGARSYGNPQQPSFAAPGGGRSGGPALRVDQSCILSGAGRCSGGGGGGGGGGHGSLFPGGGGGGGVGPALGGNGGTGIGGGGEVGFYAGNGAASTPTTAGRGGIGFPNSDYPQNLFNSNAGTYRATSGAGGTGGGLGQAGGNGVNGFVSNSRGTAGNGAAGGAAGAAVDGASRVTNLASTSVSLVGPRIN